MPTSQRNVVITGANRGLGLELARQCLLRGDSVWAGCRSPESAEELRALPAVKVLPLDVSQAASIEAFGRAVASGCERVDLLINNAGVNGTSFGADADASGVLELSGENFLAQMKVNAVGPMLLTRALLPLLRRGRPPVVANVSSQLGSLSLGAQMRRDIGYNASKAALNMVSVALAGTLGPEGLIVVALHPGWVRTDMGGAEATLSTEASARALLGTLSALGPEKNGCFLRWDGTPHPW